MKRTVFVAFALLLLPLNIPHVSLAQNSSTNYLWPSWSPDGSRIAFAAPIGGDLEIYTMTVDGTDLVQVTDNSALDLYPSWSPDGQSIVYASRAAAGAQADIFRMDANGSNAVQLTNDEAEDEMPAWSPNGEQIAFVSERDGNKDVFLMDVDGGNVTNLSHDPAEDIYPAWAPDGTRLAFASDREGDHEIFIMDVDGSNLVQITDNSYLDYNPSWSPDGNHIAYIAYDENWLHVMAVDGSEDINLSSHFYNYNHPSWSPDSQSLVVSIWDDGAAHIYRLDATENAEHVNLTINLEPPADISPAENTPVLAADLPEGVIKLALGTEFNDPQSCDIMSPLSAPVTFPAGTTQLAFQVRYDPDLIRRVRVQIEGELSASGIMGTNCNTYGIYNGQAVQNQIGAIVEATDGSPLAPGRYSLIVTFDGTEVTIPFEIE